MKHFVSYQREVYKGKLKAVASLGKLAFRALLRRKAHARNVSLSKLATAVNLPL